MSVNCCGDIKLIIQQNLWKLPDNIVNLSEIIHVLQQSTIWTFQYSLSKNRNNIINYYYYLQGFPTDPGVLAVLDGSEGISDVQQGLREDSG